METEPAVVPNPNIKVAIRAVTRVGRVLATENSNLTKMMTTLLFIMFEDASIAIGMAMRAPTREPMILIFMVSNKGPQMDGMYDGSGGNIFARITQNWFPLLTRVEKLKPVTLTEIIVATSSTKMIRGVLDAFSSIF